ncbi:MAG: hypothetical protein QNJ62_06130 [Methyloceanibacter sp.]|nr:hypothetical protein [Methyloceanibacter sp.]
MVTTLSTDTIIAEADKALTEVESQVWWADHTALASAVQRLKELRDKDNKAPSPTHGERDG